MNDIRKYEPQNWKDFQFLWCLVAASFPILFAVFGAGWWSVPLGPVAATGILGAMFCRSTKRTYLRALVSRSSITPIEASTHPQINTCNFDLPRNQLESLGFKAETQIMYYERQGHLYQPLSHSEHGCVAMLTAPARSEPEPPATNIELWSGFDIERVWKEETSLVSAATIFSWLGGRDVPSEKFGYELCTRNTPTPGSQIYWPYQRRLQFMRRHAGAEELLASHLASCQKVAARLGRSWEYERLGDAFAVFSRRRTRILYWRVYRSPACVLVLRWIFAHEPKEYWGDLFDN